MDISGKMLAVALCGAVGFAIAEEKTAQDIDLSLERYVREFNAQDDEKYRNAFPNADALGVLKANVPAFECPDERIVRTYYFRWWTFRKHLKRTKAGGRVITEFLPGVFWSGKENTISCPLGHHIRDGRWFGDGTWAKDHLKFMLEEGNVTGKAAYVNWPAVCALDLEKVTGDRGYTDALLPKLVAHHRAWEKGWETGYGLTGISKIGLYCMCDNLEGMEVSPSGYGARPIINSAFCANAAALAKLGSRTGDTKLAAEYEAKARTLADNIRTNLWNEQLGFYTAWKMYPYQFKQGPEKKSLSSVRELNGYAPWYFGLDTTGRDAAWQAFVSTNVFAAPFGPSCVDRGTKAFKLDYNGHECQWNGPSWPYVTSMALAAMADWLRAGGTTEGVTKDDFVKLLHQYAASHVRTLEDGRTIDWIDENLNPLTGDWISRTVLINRAKKKGEKYTWERGKDYNHSSFADLVISGLCGIVPKTDGLFEVKPLIPDSWDYFALRRLPYHGKRYNVFFDRTGRRYGKGKGIVIEECKRPAPRGPLAIRLAADEDVMGIVHWGLNTYTDREWGFGDEDPKLLDPADFNPNQIAKACAAGGLSGLVIVAKHHDGFCLWPTKTTEHNITKSPFRGGKGDYVREMSEACRNAGLRFGVYVSPWDRNNAAYGTEEYVRLYHEQIRELLGGAYGDVFEMWFDGAMGGDGWYGGKREKRRIKDGYYRFDEVFAFVRGLQPRACIFANEYDAADLRWPGNERGNLDADSRATICTVGGYADGRYGNPDYGKHLNTGCADGAFFKMCEGDFPLRPGWFYHTSEKGKSKHAAYLMNRYLQTVGNGAIMNIGISPNKEGRLDDEDVRALKGFKTIRDAFFAKEVTDGSPFNVIVLREDLAEGERVDKWEVCAGKRVLCSGKSIGNKRIRVLDAPVTPGADKVFVRHNVAEKGAVTLRRYLADPELVRQVKSATTESGETDTAKWMTGAAPAPQKAQ